MFISIPNKKTINEYNDLKKTKRSVKMSETSKRLDEYVYDKYSGLKLLGTGALAIGFHVVAKDIFTKEIPFSKDIKKNRRYINLLSGVIISCLVLNAAEYLNEKRSKLSDKNVKAQIYRDNGINAIV